MTDPTTSPALAALLARTRPPAAAEPPRLPEIRDEPALQQADDAQARYLIDVQLARTDRRELPVFQAARVVKLYNALVGRLTSLWQDVDTRRRARLEWLQSQLPIGPAITPGTSPADREVLLAAWHAALQKARDTDRAGRGGMLADAERFGDETVRRAVFTASYDASEWQLLDDWVAAASPETSALLDEWRDLNALVVGVSGDVWETKLRMTLRAPGKPPEVFGLPALVDAYNNTARRNGSGPAQDSLDINQLLA